MFKMLIAVGGVDLWPGHKGQDIKVLWSGGRGLKSSKMYYIICVLFHGESQPRFPALGIVSKTSNATIARNDMVLTMSVVSCKQWSISWIWGYVESGVTPVQYDEQLIILYHKESVHKEFTELICFYWDANWNWIIITYICVRLHY